MLETFAQRQAALAAKVQALRNRQEVEENFGFWEFNDM